VIDESVGRFIGSDCFDHVKEGSGRR
jgi:hypothetical protein